MRILHTSDWHLGMLTGHFSRREEHEAFFGWLTRLLAEQAVDALIVAGDVFDGMQPSSESLRLYYRFLRELEATGVRDVVVVGGNHDSAAQLDAPREVLAALSVHVTGGYSGDAEPRKYLAPLRVRGSDEPAAICVALPYIHEYRLGIRTTDSDAEATRRCFVERFRALYSELATLAEREFPGLPLIATGHLTMGKVQAGDAPQEIHQVGFIDSLPAEVLDPRLRYVALGHIHRAFPVERDRIWYSGSPIPVSVVEMRRPRQVLMVELPQGDREARAAPGAAEATGAFPTARVTQLDVPIVRELLEFEGTEDEAITWIGTLGRDSKLPPFLHLRVRLAVPSPQLAVRIRLALEQFPSETRPLLVELRELWLGADNELSEPDAISLEELTKQQVFTRLCSQKRIAPNAELLKAFDFICTAQREELEALIAAVAQSGAAARVEPLNGTLAGASSGEGDR